MAPIAFTSEDASAGLKVLGRQLETYEWLDADRSREEYGSVEGTILVAGFEYNQPAIKYRNGLAAARFGAAFQRRDGKNSARPLTFATCGSVAGYLCAEGSYMIKMVILFVFMRQALTEIQPRLVAIEELRDPQFTGGIGVREYLDLLREGEIGI